MAIGYQGAKERSAKGRSRRVCARRRGVALVALPATGGAWCGPLTTVSRARPSSWAHLPHGTGVAVDHREDPRGVPGRISTVNAQGGVNGRKIEVVVAGRCVVGANLATPAGPRGQRARVRGRGTRTPFAFLSYRFLLYAQRADYRQWCRPYVLPAEGRTSRSSAGNSQPFGDVTYDTPARVMKMLGAKKVGVLAYGSAQSSSSTPRIVMKYAVPGVGLDPAYTNTSVDFAPQMSSSGARHRERGRQRRLPADGRGDEHRRSRRGCSGVNMKAIVLATGYGQDFLDSPPPEALPSTRSCRTCETGGAQGRGHEAFPGRPEEYANITGAPRLRDVHGISASVASGDSPRCAGGRPGSPRGPPRPHRRYPTTAAATYTRQALLPAIDLSLAGTATDAAGTLVQSYHSWSTASSCCTRRAASRSRASSSAHRKPWPTPRGAAATATTTTAARATP